MSESHKLASDFFILARNSLYLTAGMLVGTIGASEMGSAYLNFVGEDSKELTNVALNNVKWEMIGGLGLTTLLGLIGLGVLAHGDDHH